DLRLGDVDVPWVVWHRALGVVAGERVVVAHPGDGDLAGTTGGAPRPDVGVVVGVDARRLGPRPTRGRRVRVPDARGSRPGAALIPDGIEVAPGVDVDRRPVAEHAHAGGDRAELGGQGRGDDWVEGIPEGGDLERPATEVGLV